MTSLRIIAYNGFYWLKQNLTSGSKASLNSWAENNYQRAPYGVFSPKYSYDFKAPLQYPLLHIVWCPVKPIYNLKFAGARTMFCRINKDKVTLSDGFLTSDGHRTILNW